MEISPVERTDAHRLNPVTKSKFIVTVILLFHCSTLIKEWYLKRHEAVE